MSEDLGNEDAPAQPQTCGGDTEDVGARTGGTAAGTPAPLPTSGVAAAEGVLARNGPRVATSSYRGVCWHRKSKRWQAAINSSGRHVYLGSFDTEEEAARMFDKVALRVRGSRAKLNFPYEDYVGPNGELVTDAKLEALVREARKALIEKQRMLEAQEEAGGSAKRRRYGNGFDDDLPVTMHVGVGPGGAVGVAPGSGVAFPLTLSPGGGYPPVAADPLAAALARSGVAAAGMPHVTVNVSPAGAAAAAPAAPAAAVNPAGGSSTDVLMGLLQASLANGSGAAAAASGPSPASANGGVEGLLQALAPRLGLSNAAGGGGNISINVNSLSSAAAAGGGVHLNLEGALAQQLLPTLLTQLNNNGSSGITIHASGPAPSPLTCSAADAPPSPCHLHIVSTSRPQPLGTSTAAAALNLARAGSSIQLGPAAPNFSRTSSPPALATTTTDAPAPRSPNHQHHASAWQPVAPAAAPRPVKSDPAAPPNHSNDSDILSHRHHSEPTSSGGRAQPAGQSSAATHGPTSDATCSNGSVVSRFLAAVLRSIPEGATVDCVVPCKDSGLMGYTWTPAPPGSASNAPSGSGSAHQQEGGREQQQQQQGRPGAGVWIQGACRSLGTYTTAEDALTACQACMAMLLDFKESLASNSCRNGTAPNAVASASASSGTGMAAAPPPQAGSSGGAVAAAPPSDRLDTQNANGHPPLARRSSFLLPSSGRVDSSEPAVAAAAAATAADPFARLSACEQPQQQNQQASAASRPCSNDGSVGAARKPPGAAAAAAAPAATTDEQLAADTLSLMLRRHQSGPLPRQPSTHAANALQQQQQQQAADPSRVPQQPAPPRAEGLQLTHTQQQQQQQQVSFRRAPDQPHVVGGSPNSAFVPAVPRAMEAAAHPGPIHLMQQQHQQQQQIVINAVPRTAVPVVAAQDSNRTEGRTAQGFTFSRQQPVRQAGCGAEEERPRQRLCVSGPAARDVQVQQQQVQQQQRPLQVQLQGTNIMLDLQALANKSHGRLTMADLVRAAGALSMVNV